MSSIPKNGPTLLGRMIFWTSEHTRTHTHLPVDLHSISQHLFGQTVALQLVQDQTLRDLNGDKRIKNHISVFNGS